MISKSTFVDAINSIKRVNDYCNSIDHINREFEYGYDYTKYDIISGLEDQIANVLMDEMHDDKDESMISWWLYDCNYGKDATKVIIENEDGSSESYDINTPELLYDFLVMCMEKKNDD